MKKFAVIGCVFFLFFMVAPVMAADVAIISGGEEFVGEITERLDGLEDVAIGRVRRYNVYSNRTVTLTWTGVTLTVTGNWGKSIVPVVEGSHKHGGSLWLVRNAAGSILAIGHGN